MAALGSRPAREITTREITTREIEDLLRSIATTGVSPRTVNKHRQLICAIFSYGTRAGTYALPANPARETDRRTEPDPAVLAFYAPEDVEAVARSLAAGRHRDPGGAAVGPEEAAASRASRRQWGIRGSRQPSAISMPGRRARWPTGSLASSQAGSMR